MQASGVTAEDERTSRSDEGDQEAQASEETQEGERRVEAKGPPPPDNSAAQKNLQRPSAEEIYQQVARNARDELKRRSISLAVSGFTGGTFMGFSALGVGIVLAMLGSGSGAFLLSRMLYPLGFIVVMIGRSQLFTENTLYPVALIMAEKKEFWNTARLWAIVLPTNLLAPWRFQGSSPLPTQRRTTLSPLSRSWV